jgi:hypothetical protein
MLIDIAKTCSRIFREMILEKCYLKTALCVLAIVVPNISGHSQDLQVGMEEGGGRFESIGIYIVNQKLRNEMISFLDISMRKKRSGQIDIQAWIFMRNDSLMITKVQLGDSLTKDWTRLRVVKKIGYLATRDQTMIGAYQDFMKDFSIIEDRECSPALHRPPKEDMWKSIGYSRNSWEISWDDQKCQSCFRYGFKHKLLKFRCMPLGKNIKQRKLVKKFFKDLGLSY